MTIQFLRAWNGFEQHQVVSTLSAEEEVRLVGLTLARNYVDGIDGVSGTQVDVRPGGQSTYLENNKSILTIGGDHPYRQWWGRNGRDGMFQMYADLGIKPYIAICADEATDNTSGNGATLGKSGMLSIVQAQDLEGRGAEFVSHGSRHTHFWELLNTGIRVYYTGAEATPTVNISTTQLTTSTATTGATAFTWAAYPTVAELQTAINALAGWNCILATELTGTEPSSALMPLNAARSVASLGGADTTNSNQRFALCGGIMIRYAGLTYRDVSISVNDGSNFLGIFADGARLLATTTAATLTAIVTAINNLNIVGLTALVMDNGYAAQSVAGSTVLNPGQKQRETYCFGDELGTGLHRVAQAQSVNFTGIQVTGGLGFAYALRRSVLSVKERAASVYGVAVASFAQPGGRINPWHVRTIADEHVGWRGNRSFTENYSGISPHAMPANLPGQFTGHFTSIVASSPSSPYGEGDVKAVADALADTGGWCVNWLNHLCTPTPGDPSPYRGMDQHAGAVYTSSADQDEGPFWRELQYAAAKRDAGLIEILPPTVAEKVRAVRKGPTNLVFNPRFRNGRANNLLGITTTAHGSGGIACPGWAIASAAADFSVVAVNADGELTITTNGALASGKTPIGCNLFLEPGKTYDIGAALNLLNWGAANNCRWALYPMQNGLGKGFTIAQPSVSSHPFFGGGMYDGNLRFTVPPRGNPTPAYVRGIAGAFAFTAGDAISIQIDNRAASAAIVLTGLTTAKAVASAINTALAADATYAPLAQYHNVARAEDNRLIIEAPMLSGVPGDASSLMTLANSVGTPLATLFGAGISTVRATGRACDLMDATMIGYRLTLVPSLTSATQTLKLQFPYCREVKL